MATFPISLPENFNFSSAQDWPKWIRRFKRFRIGSGLHAKAEENQINVPIYIMGDKADDILSSFGLTDEEQKKYDTVKAKFNQCRQQEGRL